MPIVIKFDDKAMRKFVRTMPKASKRSQMRSLNKAITQTRTQAARAVSVKRNIKVGVARNEMKLNKASSTRLEAAIFARGNPINLIDVKGAKTQTKRGVTAKIGPGKRHLFKGAFIATSPGGHTGVFERVSRLTHVSKKDSKGTTRFNLPIREIRLPSVASTLIQDEVSDKLQRFGISAYEKELIRLIKVEMVKAGAK